LELVGGVLTALEKLHEQVVNAMSRSQAFGLFDKESKVAFDRDGLG